MLDKGATIEQKSAQQPLRGFREIRDKVTDRLLFYYNRNTRQIHIRKGKEDTIVNLSDYDKD